eukprot:scaffold220511_cov35-Tisochrysis_lutea.AAC.1
MALLDLNCRPSHGVANYVAYFAHTCVAPQERAVGSPWKSSRSWTVANCNHSGSVLSARGCCLLGVVVAWNCRASNSE